MNLIKKTLKALTPISKQEMNKVYHSRANYIHELEERMKKMENKKIDKFVK